MLYYLLKYSPFVLLAAPTALWLYLNLRTAREARILLLSIMVLGGAIVATGALAGIAQIPHDDWSASRLAPAVAWAKGYRMYYGPGEGPALVRMYGPVPWMLYAPTAFLRTPTCAMLAAAAVNLLCFTLPAVWLLWCCSAGCNRVERLAGLALFGVMAVFSRPLFDSAFAVSVDGPAIGFAAATCAVVLDAGDVTRARTALLAGFFASLSVWSKQTMWPFVLAPVIYVLLTQRLGVAVRFAAVFSLMIFFSSITLVLAFGWREMLYNMHTIPSRHPWQWSWLRAVKMIARECGWPTVVLTVALLLRADWRSPGCWILPALAALLVVPTSALAYAKIGGRANNAAPAVYLLWLAGAGAAIRLLHVSADSPSRSQRLALLFVTCNFIAMPIVQWNELMRVPDRLVGWREPFTNETEQAFRMAREHAGRIYFPQQPLASLFAEGRACHTEAAVADLHLAGLRLEPAQLRAGVPPEVRGVAYRGAFGGLMLHYLPQFQHTATTGELPGWTLFWRTEAP